MTSTLFELGLQEFDGKNLTKLRNFLVDNKIKKKVESIAEYHFSSAFDLLVNLGFDRGSDLYKFIKVIQGRHS